MTAQQFVNSILAATVGTAYALLCLLAGMELGERRFTPCAEDQAYVVAVDRNPDHGLTWVCRGLDELRAGE